MAARKGAAPIQAGSIEVIEKSRCACGGLQHALIRQAGGKSSTTCLNTDNATMARQKVADMRARRALSRDAEFHGDSDEEEENLRTKGFR
jgi:hypothetical protein